MFGNSNKKLISFDLDDTLIKSPLPAEGKQIWKEKTGEEWPHRGWWSKPESLDMDVFEIPLNKKIYRRYQQAISDPDNYVILATGRVAPLRDEVYTILDHYGLEFDEIHLNPGIDTFEFKSNLFAKLIYELQPEEFIMYDDRQEHLVKFVSWANAMPCKVTIIDAISGEEFKSEQDSLKESIKRILRQETSLEKTLLDVMDKETIFDAANLVGDMENLKSIFKDNPKVLNRINNQNGKVAIYWFASGEPTVFLDFDIVDIKYNRWGTNFWGLTNVKYDESKLTEEENMLFKTYLIDSFDEEGSFEIIDFNSYDLNKRRFNHFIELEQINGVFVDEIERREDRIDKKHIEEIRDKLKNQ